MNLRTRLFNRLFVSGILLTVFIFFCDIIFPPAFNVEFAYLLILLLTFWVPGRRISFDTAIAVTCLTIIAYFFSTHSKQESDWAIANRMLAIAATWAGTYVIIQYKNSIESVSLNQERLDAMFKYATEGIIISNAKGEIVLANPRAEKQFGYEETRLKSTSIEALIPSRFAPNHGIHRKKFYHDPRARAMGKGIELFAKKKNGEEFPVEISLSTFKIKDELFVISFIIDITERKSNEATIQKVNSELKEKAAAIQKLNEDLEHRVSQRTGELANANEALEESNRNLQQEVIERSRIEEALRDSERLFGTIAHNFPNGWIVVLDRNLRRVFIDGKELQAIGVSKEDLVGKTLMEKELLPVNENVISRLQKVFEWQSDNFDVTFENGRMYSVNAVPLPDIKGFVKEILMVIQDVTEIRNAENEIREALEKEKELNEMKSKFVSIASHEFRTPLSTILSSVSLVDKYDKPEDSEKRHKHIDRIKSSVKNLTEILNDFLSLEKLEVGKVEAHPDEIDLVHFSEDLREEMQTLAKHGQHIIYRHEGDVQTASLDKQLLKNILMNLLNNAIKYSPEEKNIELTTRINDQFVELSVKDYGVGIPEEDQEHLFERFFRAQNVTGIQGTGLGLNIVRRYIKLMHGTIEFSSHVNKGSTFIVKFPLEKKPVQS
ncbi:MAG: PAS domain-containing sensor histidine kinase [Bacteroidetes bacterium]|nr:PAS domain-containing sensor histidine kinase [Bacteroidota bacterium]